MLEEKNHYENKNSQQQVFHRTEIFCIISASEGIDAYRDQAQTNRHNDRTGYHRRKEFSKGL